MTRAPAHDDLIVRSTPSAIGRCPVSSPPLSTTDRAAGAPQAGTHLADQGGEGDSGAPGNGQGERFTAIEDERGHGRPGLRGRAVMPPLHQRRHVGAAGRPEHYLPQCSQPGPGVVTAGQLPHRLTHHPVTAPLVPEEVAPTTGSLLSAADQAHGDRPCPGHAGDPVGHVSGGEHQPGVVDHDHPTCGGHRRQQADEEGHGVGRPATGATDAHGVETGARTERQLVEQAAHGPGGALPARRGQAGTGRRGLRHRLAVADQLRPAVGAADVKAQHRAHRPGTASVRGGSTPSTPVGS